MGCLLRYHIILNISSVSHGIYRNITNVRYSSQALTGLERMQELVGKNLNNIVGNLWQRQEEGSGSSHGNMVSFLPYLYSMYMNSLAICER